MVSQDQNPKRILYKSFPGKDKTKLEALPNFTHTSSSDAICKVKTGRKDVVIPKNSTVAVSCHGNTGPVLFEPDKLAQLPEGLKASETLLNIKPFRVKVRVCNATDHDIMRKSCT